MIKCPYLDEGCLSYTDSCKTTKCKFILNKESENDGHSKGNCNPIY